MAYGSDSLTNLQRSNLVACQPVIEVEQNPLSAEEHVRAGGPPRSLA
jgi:hypothetical protein